MHRACLQETLEFQGFCKLQPIGGVQLKISKLLRISSNLAHLGEYIFTRRLGKGQHDLKTRTMKLEGISWLIERAGIGDICAIVVLHD